MEPNVAQIYLCPPGPPFPSTHCEHQDEAVTGDSVTLPPSADSLPNTHMFDFTGEVAREPSHDGKANLFRKEE